MEAKDTKGSKRYLQKQNILMEAKDTNGSKRCLLNRKILIFKPKYT